MSAALATTRRDGAFIAGALVALLLLVAVVANALGAFEAGLALNLDARFLPPGAQHLFGTDALGRDVGAMIAAGATASLGVALSAVAIGLLGGVPLGLLAAARGGLADEGVARVNDVLFALPPLLLAVLLAATLGPGALTAILALGLFNIPVFARVTRASARTLLTRDFVNAARVAGKGPLAIGFQHLLPNLSGLLIAQATIQIALAIAAEAGLSYVGLGAQPPAPSWGRMLHDAQTLTAIAPWLAWFPGLALAGSVLGFSILGDRLRERLDPKAGR